jgi:hypothetical protein
MTTADRELRYLLTFHGLYALTFNLWALIGTASFLARVDPAGSLFQARSFAALCIVLGAYFLAGAWRADLRKPAAFLGLGSSLAIALVALFHLPTLGWTLQWLDFLIQLGLVALYCTLFFFRREKEEAAPVIPAQPEPVRQKKLIAEDLPTEDDHDVDAR